MHLTYIGLGAVLSQTDEGDEHPVAYASRKLLPHEVNYSTIERVPALQKQVGCFNHRVVPLVADKLERKWSLEVCFDVED